MRKISTSRREYPDRPLVGVGAVVVREDGCVLLVQRRQPPRSGEWSLPGGLVELGERLDEAVQREVREECGIEVQVGPLVGVFQPIERDATGAVRFHYVVLDYLACYAGGTICTSSDAGDAVWVSPDQLDRYQLRPETTEMIRRALAIYQSSDAFTALEC
ncbi:MAG: NUDIX hydrolase [Anaerolineae bacterium]|nr:NUDIX hydrolase [Anaerolineae bacterium]